MIKRALISVYNKQGLLELAQFLTGREVEIISTGGTYRYLVENNIKVTEVSEVTGFDEILDGRVKTLHPAIHAGILARRDNKAHMDTIKSKNILPIDMVVVNLYPFFDKVCDNISFDEKIEFIDIGGPTMIRAAAKNFKDVIVVTDVEDYSPIIEEIKSSGDVRYELRRKLAGKVFNLMSAYDGAISNFLLEEEYPEYLSLSYKKSEDLRYGENPHQSAAYYTETVGKAPMKNFEQLSGKKLSYNNMRDMDMAWKAVNEFDQICCVAVKHNTPCGVAIGKDLHEAYVRAYECDPTSIFGGIIALNRKVDVKTAEEIVKIFVEIVIAPDFDGDAVEVLEQKKNLRIIKCEARPTNDYEIAKLDGGILVQSADTKLVDVMKVVTEKKPSKEEMDNLIFGMKVCKYVKSNAIVVVKDFMAKGIGGGQVNRIWPACQALDRAKDGVVLASDAFFPFNDVVVEAAKYGIKAIIQPGGSIRDEDSIEECNKNGISMVFTGTRHFKH
ncbi:bifunctional phosphoribosylaminoimidazolecarboxamide formyltransferase/IMP cyclohydrolase [Clostridium luticellarii]|jgi:phosphoribosylaminoimidazolecarboxamide formyltransferase/IMP cyclohydrolase|uniref:Bifunctional purine biosynthesis protein PurH n=1 Tax=Clostridium luticellarii TaxID=1691940 RepID=A0A2T0BJM3_9CLOT|nr:bifunctional phosphoribosylaminoimidazolecarboxamide formyltransferase/IMP cyclohydrolase [Clostridium luticellarii]MCI1944073.1 bifunctional phosphoribosylaminoimidazolecarboxamide formyltransferase/IMP cyclohydrolase [Clostridium luticellarii]MCI1967285.1 bifunctional phosphoribosylaminoimidazolecarboxamide formyltransferase/IMP cyclohydrolase [Clostridium luticellarii]MCI1995197.1 bifunctional phosphoribosylaminoimidazolecarboxamide formyltransferase/IMP cyclohydrolase [Clostridium luticel